MGRTSVALTNGLPVEPFLVRRLDPGHGQAEALMPLVGSLMAEASVPFSSLERVAVCVGPGGFSGIRTGVAAARGIALAAEVPIVGATSFRIMAAAFEQDDSPPETYGLVAQAGQNAVYCQIFERGGVPRTDILALPQSEADAFFAGRAEILTGPAAAALSEAGYVSLPIKVAALGPDAATLARIAPGLNPERDLPSPYYVRPADAKPQTRHRIPRKSD
jgi:tRNA threonylcarbamoyladenosine biosynthesis protein TsaB